MSRKASDNIDYARGWAFVEKLIAESAPEDDLSVEEILARVEAAGLDVSGAPSLEELLAAVERKAKAREQSAPAPKKRDE
jgi:hypothetical protein